MTQTRWILRNVARRPIELHHPSGSVTVLAPFATIEVETIDAQCRALLRQGALTRHDAPPPAAAPEAKPPRGRRPGVRAKPAAEGPAAPARRGRLAKPAKTAAGRRRKSGAGQSTGADE